MWTNAGLSRYSSAAMSTTSRGSVSMRTRAIAACHQMLQQVSPRGWEENDRALALIRSLQTKTACYSRNRRLHDDALVFPAISVPLRLHNQLAQE